MADHHHPRLRHVESASHIFKEATVIMSSNIFIFLFLILFITVLRTVVEITGLPITSFIDNDPSLTALLSRLKASGNGNNINDGNDRHHLQPSDDSSAAKAALRRRHHRQFLHSMRAGILEDDFFSGDDDEDRSLFESSRNATAVVLGDFNLNPGFSDLVVDNGIRVSEVVHSGIKFKTENLLFADMIDTDVNGDDQEKENADVGSENVKENEDVGSENVEEGDKVDHLPFIEAFCLTFGDVGTFCFLMFSLLAFYCCLILNFLLPYAWVQEIVFVTVVNDLLRRDKSLRSAISDGSRLDTMTLFGFILKNWLVRDALTVLLLGLWHFVKYGDLHSFWKLFVRLKLIPFSAISGSIFEVSPLLVTWCLMDTFVLFIFSVGSWVAIVDPKKNFREIVREGLYLISIKMFQAMQIKLFEVLFCGVFLRAVWVQLFGVSFGMYFGMIFQSAVEFYLMVAWLIYYFAARCRHARLQRTWFTRKDLEEMFQGLLRLQELQA